MCSVWTGLDSGHGQKEIKVQASRKIFKCAIVYISSIILLFCFPKSSKEG